MFTNGKGSAAQKLVDHVASRTDQGAEEYGATNFWHVPLIGEPNTHGKSLFDELFEETADVFGWGGFASIRMQAAGWKDLVTKLELAATGAIHLGNGLKTIEDEIARRLRET